MPKGVLLLIEDNPLLNAMYKAALEAKGFTVLFAHGGKEGIELAREKKPRVIVLDLLMPGVDGFEVLKTLKGDSTTKDIRIVILTVIREQEAQEKAKRLGAVDYLIKSDLKLDEIVNRIAKYFAGDSKTK